MKVQTIGWEAALKVKVEGQGPRDDFILHPNGGSTLSLEQIVQAIRGFSPDVVVMDIDVFREIADRIDALQMRMTRDH